MNIYDDTNRLTKDAVDSSLKSFAIMSKGLQQVAAETSDYSKRAYDRQASFFEELMQVKSLDKSFQVQSEYVRSAYENWLAQASKVGEIYVDTVRKACEPLEAGAHAVAATGSNVAEKTIDKMESSIDTATEAARETAEKAKPEYN